MYYARVQRFDRAAGGADVAIDLSKVQPLAPGAVAVAAAPTSTAASAVVLPGASAAPTTAVVTVAPVQPPGPARMVIVGDSQAHALAINLPTGIESAFTISDGSVEGCSVYDDGTVRSARTSFNRTFADCGGWADKWGKAAGKAKAQIALVVLGAWDVFDVEVAGHVIAFGTPAADQRFIENLGSGVAALRAAGSKVALLEVPCMRPKDVKGAGVPALPERADDAARGSLEPAVAPGRCRRSRQRHLRQWPDAVVQRPGDLDGPRLPLGWGARVQTRRQVDLRDDRSGAAVHPPELAAPPISA